MQFILVFTIILVQICPVNLLKVVQVVRAFRIQAFMDDEVLPVFLTNQRMGAVRTLEGKGFGETVLIWRKEGSADLAHQLAGFAVVTVQVRLRRFAGGAGAMLRDIALRAAADRLNGFSVFPRVVAIEILPVPILVMVDDPGKLVHLEFLIPGGMGIIKGPLLKRDISADKVNQPAVLLIKLMAQLKKIKYNVHEHCLFCVVKVWSLTLYQKGRTMLFLFAPPVKSRDSHYKQVVNLTLPILARRKPNEERQCYVRSRCKL